MPELDLSRLKEDIHMMIQKDAPEKDIDEYLSLHGTTAEALRGVARAGSIKEEKEPGVVYSALSGFNEGVANILGLPVDLASSVVKAAGIKLPEQALSSEFFKRGLRSVGAITEPKTRTERLVSRVGEEVGAASVPFMGIYAKAIQAGKGIATSGAGAVKTAVQDYLRALSEMEPKKLAAIETTLAATSGAGAGVAKEMFPDSKTAEFIGQMVGTLGPVGSMSLMRRVKEGLAKRLPPLTAGAQQRQVGKMLAESATSSPAYSRNLEEAADIAEEVPGFKPTFGQASGAPGTIAMERAAVRRGFETTGRAAEQAGESNQAIRRALQEAAGEGESIPALTKAGVAKGGAEGVPEVAAAIRQRMGATEEALTAGETRVAGKVQAAEKLQERKLADLNQAMDEKIEQAKTQVSGRLAGMERTAKKPETGQVIREELLKAEEEFQAASADIYGQIDRSVPLSAKNTIGSADKINLEAGRFTKGSVPSVVDEAAEAYKESARTTFGDLTDLRSRVLEDQRIEARTSGVHTRKYRNLKTFGEAIEKDIDALAKSTDFPEEAAKYRQASAQYREGIQRLRSGVAEEVMKLGPGGRYRVGDAEVAGRFFNAKGKSREAIQDFLRAFPDNKRAIQALEDYASKDLYESAVDASGKVISTRLGEWLRKHAEPLAQFPELQKEFVSLQKAQEHADEVARSMVEARKGLKDFQIPELTAALQERESVTGRISASRSRIDKSAAKLFIDSDPDRAIARAIGSKNPSQSMAELVRFTRGDAAAQRGLRKAVWDHMTAAFESRRQDIAGDYFLNPNAMKEFLTQYRPVLSQLYKPEQLQRLDRLQTAAEILERSSKFPVGVGSDTAPNMQIAASIGPLLSRAYGIQRGVVSPGWVVGERITRKMVKAITGFSETQVRSLLEEAIFDPEFAQTLIESSRLPEQAIKTRMRAHLANMGSRAVREEKAPK